MPIYVSITCEHIGYKMRRNRTRQSRQLYAHVRIYNIDVRSESEIFQFIFLRPKITLARTQSKAWISFFTIFLIHKSIMVRGKIIIIELRNVAKSKNYRGRQIVCVLFLIARSYAMRIYIFQEDRKRESEKFIHLAWFLAFKRFLK